MTLILRAVPRRMLAPFGNQDLVAEGLTRAWSGSQECDEDRVLQRRGFSGHLEAGSCWENSGMWASCASVYMCTDTCFRRHIWWQTCAPWTAVRTRDKAVALSVTQGEEMGGKV